MKKFLKRIGLFFGVPLVVVLAVYLWTDPFKILHPFDLRDVVKTNREYQTMELFFKNNPLYDYNSFVFGSSRCCGVNTYHWKHYLPVGAKPFLFQAWSETLTGMVEKLDYIVENGNAIDNALVFFDNPKSFSVNQLPINVTDIKHYKLSGQSKWAYHACFFFWFAQKPSQWFTSIGQRLHPKEGVVLVDSITNDWQIANKDADISRQPEKDGFTNITPKARRCFLKNIEGKTDADVIQSDPLITESLLVQLRHMKDVFDSYRTDYRIVVTPAYCYIHPGINNRDLQLLQEVFGEDKVFNYSGKNEITVDYNNFTDPNHFGLSVGWQIIEDIYNSK